MLHLKNTGAKKGYGALKDSLLYMPILVDKAAHYETSTGNNITHDVTDNTKVTSE